jgi:glycosyltransferase involved in cell wall biosynthesis
MLIAYAIGLFSIVLSIAYIFIIRFYLNAWSQLESWEISSDFQAETLITIIIPARNEAANIAACLDSIFQQSYPSHLREIIVVDDHSTDQTALIAKEKGAIVLSLADYAFAKSTSSFKKKAIEYALQHASGQLIVTTDADCIAPHQWLAYISSLYQRKNAKFIAAPVNFHQETNALSYFQSLDFMGMMLITGAGISSRFMRMCNGANLAYPKEVFDQVNGFEGNEHLASGDDMFLLQKVAKAFPNDIYFLKNASATVLTAAKPTWSSFLQQRIRWGTKSSSYQEKQVTVVLALVFFFCWSILFSFLFALLWGGLYWLFFAVSFLTKVITDYRFLRTAARFFKRPQLMNHFFISQFYHIAYIILVGTLSNLIKTYTWKGRQVK